MADPEDDELPLSVRAIGAVDRLDGMYQVLIGFSVVVGVSLVAVGALVFGLVWLIGGPALVFAVQRWEG